MRLNEKAVYGISAICCAKGLAILSIGYARSNGNNALGSPISTSIPVRTLLMSNHKLSGPDNAQTSLLVFFDYQCGPCKLELRRLEYYTSNPNVAIYLYHYPLKSIHPYAYNLAILSAAGQGHTDWPQWHRVIGAALPCDETMTSLTKQAARRFGNENQTAEQLVKEDMHLAKELNVRATPTIFVVRDGQLSQLYDFELLDKVI